MASNPPGECCIKGTIHEGTVTGEVKEFAGVDTYFAYPQSKSTDKVIVFLCDIMGLYNNPKLVADQFAANGYFVVMPDIHDKDAVPTPENRVGEFDINTWLAKEIHQPSFVHVVIGRVLSEIRKDFSTLVETMYFDPKRIGAVGYCFGAKYVINLLDGQIDAGYIAHPALITMEEVAAIKGPLSIAAAEIDKYFTTELRHQSEAKFIGMKATYQLNLFGGVSHGFAIRADLKDRKQKFAKEQAFYQAVAWFNEYLD